jgi:hypothetical protein
MKKPSRENLEGEAEQLHEQILAQGKPRFPEESYRQLLLAGATPAEALQLLGYRRHPSEPPVE